MRVRLLCALAVVTPLGFATKLYAGPGASFVRFYAGGIVYEIFWILAVLALRPGLPPRRVAAWVFVATCALEVLQLWHPPLLEAVRATFLGRALIGSTFSGWDFAAYAVGCGLGLWGVHRLGYHAASLPGG